METHLNHFIVSLELETITAMPTGMLWCTTPWSPPGGPPID